MKKHLLHIKTIVFTIAMLSSMIAFSQAPQDNQDLDRRLKNLEDYQNTLNALYDNKAQELKNEVDTKFKQESEAQKKQFDQLHGKYSIIVWFGLPGTILAFIGLWIATVSFTNKRIKTKIADIVEGNRNEIISLIKSHEIDTRLRKESKLLILSNDAETESHLKRVFVQLNFDNAVFRTITGFQSYNEYDLIVFNNHNGSFNKDTITKYLENTTDQIFVALTNENLTRHERLNFANSEFTLYARVMESLKYQEIRNNS